ncbi:MAG: ATP-binding protein [Roseimicrobium sp.]
MTYDAVLRCLKREQQGLPAVEVKPEPPRAGSLVCGDCGAQEENPRGLQPTSYQCERCINAAAERQRLAWEQRPLEPWPRCWPARAILDLKGFGGTPMEKAIALKPVFEQGGMVALIGDRGRGKTVMATWFANERRKQRLDPGIYARAHDLFSAMRRTWGNKEGAHEEDILEHFRETPFLVLDEIQERGASDWENRTLVNVLDHRHASFLPTLLLGNLSVDELTANLGASILDRMKQTGYVVTCDWEGLRKPGGGLHTREEQQGVPFAEHFFTPRKSRGSHGTSGDAIPLFMHMH